MCYNTPIKVQKWGAQMDGNPEIRILLVDDEAEMRASIRELLSSYRRFCVAGEAESREAALALLDQREVDVIFSDIQMAGGSGFALAAAVGHTIIPPRGSLVPVHCAEGCCGEMAGLSLRNVTLTLWEEGKKKPLFRELGEMLFTHQGVSGPLVLSASALMRKEPGTYRLTIDMKPGLDSGQLDARLLRDFGASPNRDIGNVLGELLPRAFILPALRAAEVPPNRKIREVTREDRGRIGGVVKCFALTPVGLGPVEEAVVTAGGVKVTEVDPKTMASKVVRNLFLAGEVLDVDARTGGFNLQIAFATGHAAAMGAGR